MTVSRSQIEEALRFSDSFWDDYFDEKQEAIGELLMIARAVLSAPTVQWCQTHADQVMENLVGPDQPVVCRWGMKMDGSKDCRLVGGTVALVPMEDGE